jgi:hypothetical protein
MLLAERCPRHESGHQWGLTHPTSAPGILKEAEYGGNLTPKLKLIRDTNPENNP